MNLPGCAAGPFVGPSQLATGAVEAAMSALAAASASACAATARDATTGGAARAGAPSTCMRLPTPRAVPAVKPARLKKLLRVHVMLHLLLCTDLVASSACLEPSHSLLG